MMRRTTTRRSPTRGGGGHASRGLIFEEARRARCRCTRRRAARVLRCARCRFPTRPLATAASGIRHQASARCVQQHQLAATGTTGLGREFLTLRASPPALPETTPRRDEAIRDAGCVGANRGPAEPSKGERMRKRRLDGWMRDEGVGRRMLKWGECRMKDGEGGRRGGGRGLGRTRRGRGERTRRERRRR